MTTHKHIEQLTSCYDQHAETFATTRERFRPEIDFCLQALPTHTSKVPYTVADLWCWGGRFYKYLHEHFGKKKFTYTGIDPAKSMITTAQKTYPEGLFLTGDMQTYLFHQEQESIDAIICLASFHHLPTRAERIRTLQYAYKALRYGGRVILINRSYSHRFIKQYWPRFIHSFFAWITQTSWTRNDILIPRKGKSTKAPLLRYYHMFTLEELAELAQFTGFVLYEASYITGQGELVESWEQARNTFVVLEKWVLVPEGADRYEE